MTQKVFCLLENRGVIAVSGDDAETFLQGLVSNDVTKSTATQAIWAAFLTPQGKFLHEFMIVRQGDHFLLDCEKDRRDDLVKRLSRFRLRAKVTVEPREDFAVAVAWGPQVEADHDLKPQAGAATSQSDAIVYVDPRLAETGLRFVGPASTLHTLAEGAGYSMSTDIAYDAHRIALGLPDGSRDMEVEKALLLENGFEELGGVDYEKGCYIGQELTARTHYRALIKKRLLPVLIDGTPPPAGTELTVDGKNAGVMKSSVNGRGLALVRLDPWQTASDKGLYAESATVTPVLPSWIKLDGNAQG